VDKLVNNAGLTCVTKMEDLSFDRMQTTMVEIHPRTAPRCIQVRAPGMTVKVKGFGRVAGTGSRMVPGQPGRKAYGQDLPFVRGGDGFGPAPVRG